MTFLIVFFFGFFLLDLNLCKDWGGQRSFCNVECRTEKAVPWQEGRSNKQCSPTIPISFSNRCVISNKLHLLCSLQIRKVTEMSLSANQEREEMEKKRLVWKAESSPQEPKLARGRPVDPAKLIVELAPMEIRTFVIEISSLPNRMPPDGRDAS